MNDTSSAVSNANRRKLRITPLIAVALVSSVAAAFILRSLFWSAHRILGWVLAACVAALLLETIVNFFARYIPRVIALLIVVIGVLALIASNLLLLSVQLKSSTKAFATTAPRAAHSLEMHSSIAVNLHVEEVMNNFSTSLSKTINDKTLSLLKTSPTYFVAAIMVMYLIANGRRYLRFAVLQLFKTKHQEQVISVMAVALSRGRNLLLLQILQVLVVSVVSGFAYVALGLKAVFLLAIMTGILSLLPLIGLIIAGFASGIFAYAQQGTFGLVCVFMMIAFLDVIDSAFWKPLCDRVSVQVGYFLPLVSILIGAQIYGFGGALYTYALCVLLVAFFSATDGDLNNAAWAVDFRRTQTKSSRSKS